MTNLNPPTSDREPSQLDELLRRFFQSEMPHPWPAPPKVSRERPRMRWSTFGRRLAAAAMIGIFVAGYGVVSTLFPVAPRSRDHLQRQTGGVGRLVTPDDEQSPRQVPRRDAPKGADRSN